ncbi:hypothetical protein ES708_08667 [subsurface metagenome]
MKAGTKAYIAEEGGKVLSNLVRMAMSRSKKAKSEEEELPAPSQEPPYMPLEQKSAVEKGTACTLCSDEHLSEVSGALSEAVRFARNEGLGSREVIRRVRHARDELNAMERFDLAPEEMVKLPPDEQKIAHWALPQSRDLRHILNSMQSVDDLEQAAAKAANVADEFMAKLQKCKPGYLEAKPAEQEPELPPEVEALKKLVEERKKGK